MIDQTLSHFQIQEKLGTGGMGEVYQAVDTKLNRSVAIKVLPELFCKDPLRLGRFQREARILASLSHPNIAVIHGLEEAEEIRFLVLELVEGETLQERLAKGMLPVKEALEVCGQIAEGLEAAHEKGVVHRDLKPANVKITPSGQVKVLDFGLAKALQRETQEPSSPDSLTDQLTRRPEDPNDHERRHDQDGHHVDSKLLGEKEHERHDDHQTDENDIQHLSASPG